MISNVPWLIRGVSAWVRVYMLACTCLRACILENLVSPEICWERNLGTLCSLSDSLTWENYGKLGVERSGPICIYLVLQVPVFLSVLGFYIRSGHDLNSFFLFILLNMNPTTMPSDTLENTGGKNRDRNASSASMVYEFWLWHLSVTWVHN